MTALLVVAAAAAFGVGLGWARYYWSRDAVILRARRREQRPAERLRRLEDRDRRARARMRGPFGPGQARVLNAPQLRVQDRVPDPPPR